jgi:hypothetical protein
MKIINFLKRYAMLVLILAVISGCASSKSKETHLSNTGNATPAAEDSAGKGGGKGNSNSYKVVSGDNLWNIAASRSVYGDPYKWPLIYKANKSKISDADLIYPGQIFDIDQTPSASESRMAVNHARTRGAWSVGPIEFSDKGYLSHK